jgi:hypothetical protein
MLSGTRKDATKRDILPKLFKEVMERDPNLKRRVNILHSKLIPDKK